jgi:hypothetical protein
MASNELKLKLRSIDLSNLRSCVGISTVLNLFRCNPQEAGFQAKQIAGPPPFACRAPHYKESDVTADMLFQGAFEEMQSKNKSADPDKLAASLGFAGKTIKTLETGCEMDFHFVDAATAEVGLNDCVYTLKKQ